MADGLVANEVAAGGGGAELFTGVVIGLVYAAGCFIGRGTAEDDVDNLLAASDRCLSLKASFKVVYLRVVVHDHSDCCFYAGYYALVEDEGVVMG